MKHRITAALERFSRAMLAPAELSFGGGPAAGGGAHCLLSAPLAGVLPFLRWEPVQLAGRIIYKMPHGGHFKSVRAVLHRSCGGAGKAGKASGGVHRPDELSCLPDSGQCNADRVGGLLAQPDALTGLYSAGQTMVLGIQTVDTGVFGGILLGLLTAFVYDRTCEKAHRGILGGVSLRCAVVLCLHGGTGGGAGLWGLLCLAAYPEGHCGRHRLHCRFRQYRVVLYGFLERLLIPTGLHHLVYMPFQFSQLGGQLMVGSVTYTGAYVVMMTNITSACRFRMASCGCTPALPRTFGYFGIAGGIHLLCPGGAAAKKTALQLLPLAFTASLASITEPLDFLFCFSAPVLWLAHSSHLRQLHRAAAPCAESRRLPRTFWGRL